MALVVEKGESFRLFVLDGLGNVPERVRKL